MSKRRETTIAVFEKLHEIVAVGRLNKKALRAAFGPAVSDFQFNTAFSEARRQLRGEGYFIKPDPKEPGSYVISTAEDVTVQALDKSRHKVVKVSRDRMDLIKDAQKHNGLDQEARQRLQTEELLYSRTLNFIEVSLLKSKRPKPPGLED